MHPFTFYGKKEFVVSAKTDPIHIENSVAQYWETQRVSHSKNRYFSIIKALIASWGDLKSWKVGDSYINFPMATACSTFCDPLRGQISPIIR